MGVITLLPNGQQQFLDNDGKPLAGGFVYHYVPGTTTPSTTYVDQGLTTPNVNPIVLDAAGRATIWGNTTYRQLLTDSLGNEVWDQLTGIGPLDNLVLTNPTITGGTISGATISGGTITASIGTSQVTADGPNPNPLPSNPIQGTRTVAQFVGSFVDARNFLGLSNASLRSTMDDSSVINAALNYAQSIGGATVYLGPGPLNVPGGSEILWPGNASGISIKGDGPFSTVLNVNGNLSNSVFVIGGGTPLDFCGISGLAINCNGIAGGGSLIQFVNTHVAVVEDVFLGGGFNVGIGILGGAHQSIATIRDVNCQAAALGTACIAAGTDPAGVISGLTIESCNLFGCQFGVLLQQCNTVSISDSFISNSQTSGIGTIPSIAQSFLGLRISSCLVQNCVQPGINLNTAGGNTAYIVVSGCIVNGCNAGILVSSSSGSIDGVSITGCQINANEFSGIDVIHAGSVTIANNSLNGNAGAAPNIANGIEINNSQNCTVVGNVVTSLGPGIQAYGVFLRGTTDYCTVIGNTTSGGGTGSIGNAASGTHNVIADNTGT